jgi:hypothetical protein
VVVCALDLAAPAGASAGSMRLATYLYASGHDDVLLAAESRADDVPLNILRELTQPKTKPL